MSEATANYAAYGCWTVLIPNREDLLSNVLLSVRNRSSASFCSLAASLFISFILAPACSRDIVPSDSCVVILLRLVCCLVTELV